MSSTATHQRTRVDLAGQPAPPFLTVSSTGSTLEAALGALGKKLVDRGEGAETMTFGEDGTRCSMGVLLYTPALPPDEEAQEGGEDGLLRAMPRNHGGPFRCATTSDGAGGAGGGVEDAVQGLHGHLPFVDHIIGEFFDGRRYTALQVYSQ